MKKLTIRIKNLPLDSKAYGGQANYGLDLVPDHFRLGEAKDTLFDASTIRTTLQEVDRDEANIEAEQGETIVGDFDGDGQVEHMKVGGDRHHRGGTPLAVPEGAFVFSDTPKMKIGGEALKSFGKNEEGKKKYTPADLAKQYDINTYKAILDDKLSDPIKKRTAQMMISNYEQKLGKLALLQESMKGFPTGLPQIAMPYLMTKEEFQTQAAPEQAQPMMRQGGELRKFADGGTGRMDKYDFMNLDIDPHLKDKLSTANPKTGAKSNNWNASKYSKAEWTAIQKELGYAGPDNNKAFQSYLLERFPDIINQYHADAPGGFGMPNAKKPIDGFLGVRWDGIVDEIRRPKTDIAPVQGVGVTQKPFVSHQPELEEAGLQANPFQTTSRQDPGAKYWTQDKINVLAGMRNKANLSKYMPWEAQVTGAYADPSFYDPSRELAANSEAMNTEMMYANQFSGPQAASVRNSAVAGTGAQNAANIMSGYNKMNVDTANQFSGVDAGITNAVNAANVTRMNNLYNGSTIANQNFDNANAQADDVIRKNLLSGLDNKQKTQWFNTWYPQYNLDSQTGLVDFEAGSGHRTVTPGATPSQTSYIEAFNKLKKENPGVPDDVLKKQVELMMGQANARNTVENDGDTKSTFRGAMPQSMRDLFKFQ